VEEHTVSRFITQRYFEKLSDHLDVDVAVCGAGPSGLICAADLAGAGRKVAVFERNNHIGGGTWGGGMMFNELVVQEEAKHILEEFNIRVRPAAEEGFYTADSIEVAVALAYAALQAGAVIFNNFSVDDIIIKNDVVRGIVVNWGPVTKRGMHVDPLAVTAKAVVDATGHPSEVCAIAARKAAVTLDTPSGDVMGEKPMWMDEAEKATVESTKRVYPGLYVCGMAANNVSGAFRMGPIFGGMFMSGKKVARIILDDLSK
jgi:thiamine thiazole synthase